VTRPVVFFFIGFYCINILSLPLSPFLSSLVDKLPKKTLIYGAKYFTFNYSTLKLRLLCFHLKKLNINAYLMAVFVVRNNWIVWRVPAPESSMKINKNNKKRK
jgi:hypothetical protein